jgi:hypothetical protein
VVAWHETEVTKTGIYVQRVTAGGSPAWTPGGVQIATTARMPAVCATSTVGTFVSWIDLANDARIGNINDAGQPTAPGVNGISLGANGVSAFRMGLVQAGLGSVIAVWQDNSSPSRILAQKVGPGLPWGGTPRVVGAPANRHNQIPVADRDGVGGAVVAWQSLPWSGATGGIQFRTQRIDGDGTTQWGPGGIVLVDSDVVGGEYSQWTLNHTPAIATDLEAGAFVAWDDFRHTGSVPTNHDVFIQRIDLWGSAVWDGNGIRMALTGGGAEHSARLVTDRAGGVLVAFQEEFNFVRDNSEIIGARADVWGNFHWMSAAYYDTALEAFDQRDGQIVFDDSGPLPRGAIYVWLDDEEGDIYANKYEVSRPYGDVCNADTPVLQPGYYDVGLAGADSHMESTCGGVGADLWFRFIAPSDGTLVASTCGTHDTPEVDEGVDTVLSLHSACPEGGNNFQLTCNDDWTGNECAASDTLVRRDSYLEYPLVGGQEVLIRVSRFSSSYNGDVGLNIQFNAEPPSNDDCANALSIGAGSYVGTMIGATTDSSNTCAGSASDVWYVYTAPMGVTHHFFTCETSDMHGVDQGTDSVLSIHSACPEPGDTHQIACNNDANGGCETMDQGATYDSMVNYVPAAGENIWIRVARHVTSFDAEFFLHIQAETTAAGRVPREEIEGEPLRLTKIGPEVVLTWGASCVSSDLDYSVYVGPMPLWGLHEPATCTTMGLLEHRFIPPSGDNFFIVVPHNGANEGSHGTKRVGLQTFERAPSPATCYPQLIADCP